MLEKHITVTNENDIQFNKTPITGKRIVKILSLISIICFFLPLCTVSCSGQSTKINGLKSTTGFEFYDQKVDGELWCALFLIIPIVIMAFLFIKKLSQNKLSMILVAIGSIVVVALLMRYRVKVLDFVETNGAQVEFNSGYYINLISHIIILATSLFMVIILNISKLNLNLPVKAQSNLAANSIKICSNCGIALGENDMFCKSCGTKFEKKSDNKTCSICGMPIEPDQKFCMGCGNAIAETEVSCSAENTNVTAMQTPQHTQSTSQNEMILNVMQYFKNLFNIGKKIILYPSTEAGSFIASKDRNAVFGLFGLQALFSALFAVLISKNANDGINYLYVINSMLHISVFKSFILTLLVSLAMSFVFAGILMGIGIIFKNKLSYQTSLNIAAIRSISLLPVTIAAILIAFFNVFYGMLLFIMGNFAAISYLVGSYPGTSQVKNKVPLIIFISSVILSFLSLFIMMKVFSL